MALLRHLGGILVAAAGLFGQVPQAAPTASEFVRFVTVGLGGHLDTAITTYRNDQGVEVTLYAAVHIADAQYFATLQRRFVSCDALLFELVADEGKSPKKDAGGSGGVLSLLQSGLKNALELEFQLDDIDYSPANFVHADMTPTEFADSMAENGESIWSLMLRMSMSGKRPAAAPSAAAAAADEDLVAQVASSVPKFDLVQAFRSGEGRHQLRIMLASQLAQLEMGSGGRAAVSTDKGDLGQVVEGKRAGSTLLEGRNEKCLEVLQREQQNGKQKLGIYYGAAHLPHMAQRLLSMGFHQTAKEWLQAWDCTKRPDPKVDRAQWGARRKAGTEVLAIARAARAWQQQTGALAAPNFAELIKAAADQQQRLTFGEQDPWGHSYRIAQYPAASAGDFCIVDVVCNGQDGCFSTADDLHALTERELRQLRRKAGPQDGGRSGGLTAGLQSAPLAVVLAKTSSDVALIAEAARRYWGRYESWPAFEDLASADAKGQVLFTGAPADAWGNHYVLRKCTDGNNLDIRSAGPDGVLDNADDVIAFEATSDGKR
ncbi:MAG: hypothetical protein EXS02_00710 [Planctomycetes bacterium]|nr:hypothetical protein [Planctomycetota bacterium]